MQVKNIKKILTDLIPFINNSIPILEHIRLVPGKLLYCNTLQEISFNFNHNVTGLIDLKELKKVVMTLDNNDDLTFGQNLEKKHLYLAINGKIEVKFKDDFYQDYPFLPKIEDCNSTEIDVFPKEDLLKIMTSMDFIDINLLRPAMSCVSLSQEICGTNAHILYFDNLSWDFKKEEHEIEMILLSKKSALFLAKQNSDLLVTVLDLEKNHYVNYKADDFELTEILEIERYPDFKNVIPITVDCLEAIFNRDDLNKACKLADAVANTITHSMVVNFTDGEKEYSNHVIISAEDLEYEREFKRKLVVKKEVHQGERFKTVVLENGEGEDTVAIPPMTFFPAIGLNAKLAQVLLKNCSGKYVSMKISAANRGAIFDDKFLIMPVMLNL